MAKAPSRPARTSPGPGVDAGGVPVVDPTENVLSLVEAANRRQDDLRDLSYKLASARVKCIEEMATLRAEHAKEIRNLESDRLEKIRQVDVLNANTAAERAGEAIRTLATQTASNQEANRNLVAASASTLASQLTSLFAESNKRLSALELSSSEGRGKTSVVDPQMERLANMVEQLARTQDKGTGKSEGSAAIVAYVIAAISVVGALLAIVSRLGGGP